MFADQAGAALGWCSVEQPPTQVLKYHRETSRASLTNHQSCLAERPMGVSTRSNWSFTEQTVGEPSEGEVLVKTLSLSLDPAMPGWINEGNSYIAPVESRQVMGTGDVGRVLASTPPELVGKRLDKPRMGTAELARAVLALVFENNRVLPGVPQGLTTAADALHRPRVEAALRAWAPVELVLPAFPAKAPNPDKVLGPLPDLAEECALQRLSELLDSIGAIYPPGALLTICSDGHVFADAVNVKDEAVDAYKGALLALVNDPRIRWFDLGMALGEDLPPKELRKRLMEKYAETEASLKARASASKSLAVQIDGIHRFLFKDELMFAPSITKNQAKKQTRARAYEVVRRSEAWGALIADVFPQALRLSIHPQPDPSTKIGINLLGVKDPWLTPWHAAAVVDRQGTYLMHRKQAEEAGAVVVYDPSGRPSHLEFGRSASALINIFKPLVGFRTALRGSSTSSPIGQLTGEVP